MIKALKSWWSLRDKGTKRFYLISLIATVVMLVYIIVHSVIASNDPNSMFAIGIQLNRPMVGGVDDIMPRIFGTLFFLCLFYVISNVIRPLLFVLFIATNNKVQTVVKLISSTIKYACALSFIFITLSVWGVDTNAILVSAGILALIIGLGAQSLISDIIAGINIVFEGEFHVGDIVLIDNFRGQVVEIGLTTTKIIDYSSNIKVINNSKIATVVNLSSKSSVVVVEVGIEYGEDLEKLEAMLEDELKEMGKRVKVFKGAPQYMGVSALANSSVNLKFSVNCKEDDRFAAERALNREIYLLFQKHNINIPFPQVTISNRN